MTGECRGLEIALLFIQEVSPLAFPASWALSSPLNGPHYLSQKWIFTVDSEGSPLVAATGGN